MMEVGLVNDGPVGDELVGIDYTSIDSAVNTRSWHSFCPRAMFVVAY